MRTTTLCLAAAAALAGSAASQVQLNEFGYYPDAVTFATRVFIPTANTGDVTVRVDQGTARGVGGFAAATPGRINGWRGVIQDSDRTTGEAFTCAVIADDAANPGQPDPTTDLVRTGTVMTPSDTVNTGGVAWIMTVTLTTPADVLPATGSYHLAFGLSASTEQTAWAAHYTLGAAGDNPRAGTPTVTYAIDRTAGSLITPSPRMMRIFALTENPTLRGGADIDPALQRGPNPNFGVAGVFLDRTRMDGIALRLRDGNIPGASVATFIGFTGFAAAPLSLAGIAGEIHLSAPLSPVAIPGVLDANGALDQSVITFPSPVPALGSLQLQSVISDATLTTNKLTNAVEMNDA